MQNIFSKCKGTLKARNIKTKNTFFRFVFPNATFTYVKLPQKSEKSFSVLPNATHLHKHIMLLTSDVFNVAPPTSPAKGKREK
jgi:hypothetical protein